MDKNEKLASWQLPQPLWEALQQLIPEKKSHLGRPRSVNFRTILAGIFYVLRTGIQWQALSREQFGPPSTVYYYFALWADSGIFEKMWGIALETYDQLKGLDWEWQSIDGAMTKAPLGGEATGKNPTDRSKLGTKRSLMTEAQGIPVAVVSAGAHVVDKQLLESTLEAVVIEKPSPTEEITQHVCLDMGYDDVECYRVVLNQNLTPHIRSQWELKVEKKKDPTYQSRRWVVEVTHSWLNRFRKILVRFEKLVSRHLSLLQLACCYIVFKRAKSF